MFRPALITAFLFISLMFMTPMSYSAGHIVPTGVTEVQSSQLIAWYDETETGGGGSEAFSQFQVTNGSTDTGVNIHVQIFADNGSDGTDLCREHDFNDTLTPNDTALYILRNLDSTFGADPPLFGGDNVHAPIPIDIVGTRGFIVVTAVDTVTLPRQAIAHNHLFGSVVIFPGGGDDIAYSFNAMGREAVNFATGALATDGVLLDGVNNGYRLLQPSFLGFVFNDQVLSLTPNANVVSIAFSDTYSDPNGEYRAEPATAIWDPLIFDELENGTSCQQHIQTCFVTIGINDDWNTEIDEGAGSGQYVDVRLCPSVGFDGVTEFEAGSVLIDVSGLSGLDNNVGIIGLDEEPTTAESGARWMFAK